MRLVASASALANALEIASRALAENPAPSVMASALLDARGKGLLISCTDMALKIDVECPAEIKEPGWIALPAGQLRVLARNVLADTLDINANSTQAKIKWTNSRAVLSGRPGNEFPSFSGSPMVTIATISGRSLKRMLKRALLGLRRHGEITLSSSAFVACVGNSLEVLATDGLRFVWAQEKCLDVSSEGTALISQKCVDEVSKVLDDSERVQILSGQNQIVFRTPRITVSSLVVDGKYPSDQVKEPFGRPVAFSVEADREHLRAIMAIATAFSLHTSLQVSLQRGLIKFLAEGELGRYEPSITVPYEGQRLEITVNPTAVGDALGGLDKPVCQFQLLEPAGPVVVRSAENDSFRLLTLPQVRQLGRSEE